MNGTTSYSITSYITHYHHFYSASLYIQDGIEEFPLAVGCWGRHRLHSKLGFVFE